MVDNLPKGDVLDLTIEEDGTITIRTAGISSEVHKTADEFLDMLVEELRAERTTEKLKAGIGHVHHTHKHTLHIK